MIGVLNYGAGNLGSVMNALERLGAEARFVASPSELDVDASPFESIIFPGDGHFGTAMERLNEGGWTGPLKNWILSGGRFLGICIGLQLLFEESEEAPGVRGLGILPGSVRLFPGRKIPQIGWNSTKHSGKGIFHGIKDDAYFYYIHSYYCRAENGGDVCGKADYYLEYCAAIQKGKLSAVQFHPEKSGNEGMVLLKNWLFPRDGSTVENSGRETPPGRRGLARRIIPCLDVDDGRVVKGVKFTEIADAGDPVELAKRYNAEGADELCFLDIGASHKSRKTLLDIVRNVAKEVFIPLCVGGGIRSVADMRDAMNAGADKVSVCTSALMRPELLSEMAAAYGSQCVVLSIDSKKAGVDDGGNPVHHAFARGGRDDTGRGTIEWAKEAAALGAGEILLNSIDADGTGEGYDTGLTRAVLDAVPIPVIASGGAGTLRQIADVLCECGADAALVASMLHFGKTSIAEIKAFAESRGAKIRW